jgi:hypothetical protein
MSDGKYSSYNCFIDVVRVAKLVGQFLTVINTYKPTYVELVTFCVLEWLRTFVLHFLLSCFI